MTTMQDNVLPLKPALAAAAQGGYALGAFALHYTSMNGTTNFVETDHDEQLYSDPDEANGSYEKPG